VNSGGSPAVFDRLAEHPGAALQHREEMVRKSVAPTRADAALTRIAAMISLLSPIAGAAIARMASSSSSSLMPKRLAGATIRSRCRRKTPSERELTDGGRTFLE
jgi:hypothetical protein